MSAIVKGRETKNGLVLKIRNSDGTLTNKKISYKNYFLISEEDYLNNQEGLDNVISQAELTTDKHGKNYYKLYLTSNYNRNKLKDACIDAGITTYEADINAVKRFFIENQDLDLSQNNLKMCYFDIETDDRLPLESDFNRYVVANSPILSYSIKDTTGNVVIFNYNKARDKENFTENDLLQNEQQLIYEMYSDLKDYDLVFAYNGQYFDFPYIKQRAEYHGFDVSNFLQQHIDYLLIYKKYVWGTLKSYSLDSVCRHEFADEIKNNPESMKEITKIDWREKSGYNKFYDLWKNDIKLLEEYNVQDVNLMFMLENKMQFVELSCVIADLCHCLFEDTLWNSHSFDYAMLNEYYNHNLISPSKPSLEEKEERQQLKISGGYTYCYKPGLHGTLECFDYKSFYPTTAITFNISPETFVEEKNPSFKKLLEIYKPNELEFILEVINSNVTFINKNGDLNAKKYEKNIEELAEKFAVEKTMDDLMWIFINQYSSPEYTEYALKNDLVYTPADLNYDTSGWNFHPHRFYNNQDLGIYPLLSKDYITTRDAVKYQLQQIETERGKDDPEYRRKNIYEQGLKLLNNSGFGTFGFRSFRYFMLPVSDAITTSCRYIMKKSISFAKTKGYEAIFGDTDSSFLKRVEGNLTIDDMDAEYYDYYDELVLPFNTNTEIEHSHPTTKEKELKNHFIVFEHEKTFESCIAVKKKRYYFKQLMLNGKYKYSTQGGAYKKADTMPLAAKIQKALCKALLDHTYDANEWKNRILELKNDIYTDKLELSQMLMVKSMSKNSSEYGKPVIDGSTGQQKVRKSDGAPMFAPIPAHVQIFKYFEEIGHDIEVGDKIEYVIYDRSGKIIPLDKDSYLRLKAKKDEGQDITEDIKEIDYIVDAISDLYHSKSDRQKEKWSFDFNKLYDRDYYWSRIESVLVEILAVADKDNVYTLYSDCWNMTQRQLEKAISEL